MPNSSIPPMIEAFLNEVTRKHAPNAQIKFKSESSFMKLIAFFLKPFNPGFMENYITTIGDTIWIPDNFFEHPNVYDTLDVIAHETQHIIDSKRHGIGFSILYLFPQVLSVLSLLALGAFWNPWMLLCLGFLLFLAPLPAYWRFRYEIAGYRTTFIFMKVFNEGSEQEAEAIRQRAVEQLSGPSYYFAWPFPKAVDEAMKDYSWMEEPRYKEIEDFLRKEKMKDRLLPYPYKSS